MDIHLILEGEQVGPLSEAQIRQYLDEGLITPSDLASHHGMDDWMPLELVLARLPAVAPAPIPPSAPVVESPQLETGVTEEEESESEPFIMPNESAPPPEPTPPPVASQKTKRTKIVIQELLPLETTLPTPKKTGKTAIALDALRATVSLPNVAVPKEKAAAKSPGRTGKVALRAVPKLAPTPAAAPVAPPPEPEPIPAPEPAPLTPAAVEIPVEPPPVATAPVVVEVVPEIATEIPPPKPDAPPVLPTEPAAPKKNPAPSPHFAVLPKDGAFMPPSIRSINGAPPQRSKPQRFSYAGIALAVFIIGVILTCILLFASRGATATAPNPFTPRNAISPPAQTSAEAPAAAPAGPTTAGDFSARGSQRQSAGDLDGAIQDFDKALALDPQAVEVYYQRGLARQAKGDSVGATADYTQVIALDPKRADAFSNRGYIKQRQRDFDGALADYAQVLAIDPKFAVVYNNIGLIKVKKGDLDGAIAAYDQALGIDPKMAVAYYNRGAAKNAEGNLDGAIGDFTQAIAANPNIALAYADRGTARQAKHDADGALADFTQALTLDPTLIGAWYNRGLIKLQRGEFDGAVDDINHVLMIDADNAMAYDKRGLAFVGKNRPSAAIVDLKKFCELAPRDPAADEARLYIWLMATESNANGDADADLSTAVLNAWNSPPEDLTSKIAAFLLGHISEEALIANAVSPDPSRQPGQTCRVWYYAGMKRLFDSDTVNASASFQKSVATGQKDTFEYLLAQNELQALNPVSTSKPAPGN